MYCPICDERMDVVVISGVRIYLCYECEVELTKETQSATLRVRAEETVVSRSAVSLAY